MIGIFLNIPALQNQSKTVCFDTILDFKRTIIHDRAEMVIISKCPTSLRIVGQTEF